MNIVRKLYNNRLFTSSFLLSFFFVVDTILSFVRQLLVLKIFGVSGLTDAFNAANNLPDAIATLIAGGATMALVSVLAQNLTRGNGKTTWFIFSNVLNLVLLIVIPAIILVIVFSPFIVTGQYGIAPGFDPLRQKLVIDMMRWDLMASFIFIISGLFTAVLQAHEQFFLTALAPIGNILGQIICLVVLTPVLGIYGWVVGLIVGAMLHLGIQLPGIIRLKFRWKLKMDLHNSDLKKVISLTWLRIMAMFFIQLLFIFRDNFASRLVAGSITYLAYGWFIMQIPETIIGTSVGIALLPLLSAHVANKNWMSYQETLKKVIGYVLLLSVLMVALTVLFFSPFLKIAVDYFHLRLRVELLNNVTIGFMVGLPAQCLLEIFARAYYAIQDGWSYLKVTIVRVIVFCLISWLFLEKGHIVTIALADSIAVTIAVVLLLYLLPYRLRNLSLK